MRFLTRALFLLAIFACACARDEEVAPTPACTNGQVRRGELCVPRVDECGAHEIAVLGGGCTKVGLVECAPGFVADPARGTCEPSLPEAPCSGATFAVPGDASCIPVGPRSCPAGSRSDGKGSCEATLPSAPCPEGKTALPGETTCREVVGCGSGAFGDIPIEASTLHVDASYAGGGSDGSKGRPFVTIGAAVSVASGDPIIAIAAGTYAEDLEITRSVRLWGRCPALVEVRGVMAKQVVRVGAPATLRGMAIRGANVGIAIESNDVRVEETWLHDLAEGVVATKGARMRAILVERTSGNAVRVGAATVLLEDSVARDTKGILVDVFGTLTVKRSLVERSVDAGIVAHGGKLELIESVVRDHAARGIYGLIDGASRTPAEVVVTGSIVERNRHHGVGLLASKATIRGSVIRGTRPRADGSLGFGVAASPATAAKLGSELVIEDTIVEDNQAGVEVWGSKATIDRSVLRKSLSKTVGRGLLAVPDGARRGDVTLRRVLIEGNAEGGVYDEGSNVVVEECSIRANEGRGVYAQGLAGSLAAVTLRRSIVEGNRQAGIAAFAATLSVEEAIVRSTRPKASDGREGVGIAAQSTAAGACDVRVLRSLIERNHENGIVGVGATALVEGTVIRDTLPSAADQTLGAAIHAQSLPKQVAEVTVRHSLIASSHGFGIAAIGCSATIDASEVSDVESHRSDGTYGVGIAAGAAPDGTPARLAVTSSLVARCRAAGIAVIASSGDIRSSHVRDVRGAEAGSRFGDGITVVVAAHGSVLDARASVIDTIVSGSARAGVSVFGGAIDLRGSIFSCNGFDVNLETNLGSAPRLDDRGENVCGCGEGWLGCRAQSASLVPIDAPR